MSSGAWRGRRARFLPSLGLLLIPIVFVLSLRWILFEPYVIPSSSMVPTLLINDFILVNKSHYGIRLPFSKTWLFRWNEVKRGDVIIFKYPDRPQTFFIKRVLAIAGDEVSVQGGRVYINGKVNEQEPSVIEVPESIVDKFSYEGFSESNGEKAYSVIYSKDYGIHRELVNRKVPQGHFFVMGDNRDNSNDSRVWGFVPETHIMGRATYIWLSCENDTGLNFFNCQQSPYRATRVGRKIL